MSETETSLYLQIGGAPTVSRLVDAFYDRMDSEPQACAIRAMHHADLSEVRQVLKDYLTQWLGGPPHYSEQRGHPRLRQRHMGFAIDTAARDAWMACMDAAMDAEIADLQLRAAIREPMVKLADWMRNQPD